MNPTAEQIAVRTELAQYHERLSASHIEHDEEGVFSWDTWKVAQAAGLFSLPVAKQWGGQERDLLTTMYAFEGLGAGCRDSGLLFSVITNIVSAGVALDRFGSNELRQRYLPRLCAGELVSAHAITEPSGGSDVLRMKTRAVRDGDDFVLNGDKALITNGPVADIVTIYAITDETAGPLGMSAFLVERGTPGLELGPAVRTMGLRTSPIGSVTMRECRVPASQLIGQVGSGYPILEYVMKREILLTFAGVVGEMRHRLERCIQFARTRSQFGKPIGSFQAISNAIVDMKIRVESAGALVYAAGEKVARGESAAEDVAIAKIVTSENNVATSLAAVQIFGGTGYLTEAGLEKDVRAAVAGRIYSGSNEIQYNRVAAMLGL